jgi:hypothetical protein
MGYILSPLDPDVGTVRRGLHSQITGFTWQSVTTHPVFAAGVQALATRADTGVSLAIDFAGNAYKSVDGGLTWTAIAAPPDFDPGASNSNLVFEPHTGAWLFGGTGTNIDRSTNNGTSWTSIAALPLPAGQTPADTQIAVDGAGNAVAVIDFGPTTQGYGISTDGGLTWTNSGTYNKNQSGFVTWDSVGAQWIISSMQDIATGNFDVLATSPDGLTWTNHTSTNPLAGIGTPVIILPGPIYWCGAARFNGPLTQGGVSTTLSSLTATSIANLIAAENAGTLGITLPLTGSGQFAGIVNGPGHYFFFDDFGLVCNAKLAQGPYLQGLLHMRTLSQGPFIESPNDNSVSYDPIHNVYLAGGSLGSLARFAP